MNRTDREQPNSELAVEKVLAGFPNAEVFEEVRVPSGHTMNHLFVPEPAQWALRGDPFLWRELRTRGRRVPLPNALEDVAGWLGRMISEVIEQDWDGVRSHEYVFHPLLAHGGMSSGHVHVPTWRHRFIPLLLARAKALHKFSWDHEV